MTILNTLCNMICKKTIFIILKDGTMNKTIKKEPILYPKVHMTAGEMIESDNKNKTIGRFH